MKANKIISHLKGHDNIKLEKYKLTTIKIMLKNKTEN
jgi:phosphotransferase system IIB component